MKFHLINVVWGEAYTNFFLTICLPTQLSPGNLPAFRNSCQSTYKIYTTAKDAATITRHPSYLALSEVIDTEIKVFNVPDDYLRLYHHTLMTYCHNHAIVEANRDNSALIILCPDTAWSDRTFTNIIKISKTKKRVVAVPSLSVVTETFVPEFIEKFGSSDRTSISISSRDLVKLSLAHLHPLMKSYTWENKGVSNIWPSYFHWDVDGTGILTRSFRMHPLMIDPVIKNVLAPDPIDSQYLSFACPNIDDFHVVDDSDIIFVANIVKLNKEDWNQNILYNGKKSGVEESASWLKKYQGTIVQPCHQLFFQHKVKIHSQPLSLKWAEVEKDSDNIVNLILKKAESS